MKIKYLVLYFLVVFNWYNYFAQSSLFVWQNAPPLVLSSSRNSVTSFNFYKSNKLVYLYFWSSENASSKDNLFKIKKVQKHASKLNFYDIDGVEILFIALQSDKASWTNDIQKYAIEGMNNYIAIKGVKDYFIANYLVSEIPFGYLIDEEGKIVLKNPDIIQLRCFIDSKSKNIPYIETPNEISGKITHGSLNKKALVEEKIYVTDSKKDTIETVLTNKEGEFMISGIQNKSDLTLKMNKTDIVNETGNLYLESKKGDVLGDFSKTNDGYEYQLSEDDLLELKNLKGNITESKNITFDEKLFASGENQLTPLAIKKMDIVISKLNEQKNLRVEVISNTDYRGETKYNQMLSEKRSKAIVNCLIVKGIEGKRVKAIGKGESEPINECNEGVECTTQQIDANRRTEFKFYETE